MNNKGFGTIVQIGNILVSEDVVCGYFCCDYAACKGICCIKGDSGAPLEEEETELIEANYPKFSPLMSEDGRKAAEDSGFFSIDRDGDIVTPTVPGREECAYCCIKDNGDVLCSIEKCFLEGGCRWRKPVSCRLYPIRVTNLTGGGKALNVHNWDICEPARILGREKGVRVYQFLKEVLTETFGQDFYEALCAAAEHINRN